MKILDLSGSVCRLSQISRIDSDALSVVFGREGGGISLEGACDSGYRYIIGDIEVCEDHSVAMMLRFFAIGEEEERLIYRFGLLPGVKTRVCFDLNLMDNHTIYTNRTPGLLKLVCHGHRIEMEECERIELGIEETFHDVKVSLSGFHMSHQPPKDYPLEDKTLIDEFGQWKPKDWQGKIKSKDDLVDAVLRTEGPHQYPFANWSRWGGSLDYKIREGTGFFSTAKVDGRWYLLDPDGYSYFSVGVCGVSQLKPSGRIDSLEKFCTLPDSKGNEDLYHTYTARRTPYMEEETVTLFDFTGNNLKQVYGSNYRESWYKNQYHILMSNGINSSGNHPAGYWIEEDQEVITPIPFAHHLGGKFPDTEIRIFRDFPDVLSPEYERNAERFASQLRPLVDEPMMIGYFMRNEPEFNFVEDVIIAEEVLYNPKQTYCRQGLKMWLKEKYGSVESLNKQWTSTFEDFNDLDKPIKNARKISQECENDLKHYSRFLVNEYLRIPAKACKRVDCNHLNLGVRWSKAFNKDLCVGWEYMDVFSVNCYSFDPMIDMDFVMEAGVDKPILIGEFHFGALDRGLTATGLKGVVNQKERANAWRMFVQKCAEHPYGVGAHWFQFFDQFPLGRFDGENYQIGLVDVCTQPYPEMMKAVRETSEILYDIRHGKRPAYSELPKKIPMIGY